MTDNEIIKALEWNISKFGEEACFGYMDKDGCKKVNAKDVLDLINRKKEENERLKINLKAVIDERADHTEAIKEFAEHLKERWSNNYYDSPDVDFDEFVDNLAKEMEDKE